MQPVSESVLSLYLERTPGSRGHHEAARAYMPGGDTRSIAYWAPYPLYIASGGGCRIRDVDGHTYIDFVNNYTSLILGHAHPAVQAAMADQMPLGTAYAAGIPLQAELAAELCRRVPGVERLRFCNSGTEATLFALRAARAFTGRPKVIKMEGGFHGTHDAVEYSVHPDPAQAGPADAPVAVADTPGLPPGLAPDVLVAPYNDAAAVARLLAAHPGQVAAVLMEPVPGVAGYITPEPGYLEVVRDLTRRDGALLVFDEVQTLRVAPGGAQALYGVTPDLTAMAKIIGGGLPVGAFGGRAEIMELFNPARPGFISHSGTFNGNALTVAAGLAVLRELTPAAYERLSSLGARLRAGLAAAYAAAGIRGCVTGVASLLNVHFAPGPIRNYRDAARAPKELYALVHLAMLNRGIYMAPRGMMNLSLPMGEAEVDAAVAAFAEVLAELRPAVADLAPGLLA